MREGARGFSTGLSYAPGTFATIEELTALTQVAADEGWPYHTHMRYGESTVQESLAEAIATAERSGVELNVSHLYPRPIDPPDEADRLISTIEEARGRGTARDLGHDRVPARRRRVGPVAAAVGARRRDVGR